MSPRTERVAVALSGGEDSSIAALLLQGQYAETVGIHMRLWDSPEGESQARRVEEVCGVLSIPCHVVDLRDDFQRRVVDYFCSQYSKGRTPNPCVACNRHLKFGLLIERALALGAARLATGHYARIAHSGGRYRLLKATDGGRDQSYFLYTLTQEKLARILFPLGEHSRTELRAAVRDAGLPGGHRPSQDICFLSGEDYRDFISARFPQTPGDMVDTEGNPLGRHQGLAFYTIGQRHGLGLAREKPTYVVGIKAERNRIVLGSEEELYRRELGVAELSWVSGSRPEQPIVVAARIRHRSEAAEAVVHPSADRATVRFHRPQRAIAPGQAIVFYRGDEVLGGGTIESPGADGAYDETEERIAVTER